MGLIKSIWDGYVKVDEFVGDLIVSTTDHVGHKIGEFLGEDKKDVKTEVRKKTNSQVAVVNHQKGGQSRKRTLPQASVANYPKIEQRRKSQAVENASDYTKNSAFNQDNSESAVLPIKQIEQQPLSMTASAETENGFPQIAPNSMLLPSYVKTFTPMSPEVRVALGQFLATMTSCALPALTAFSV